MAFVTCASNLRSDIFSIPAQLLYTAKGIAGNIIPAIATTNAIIAGLQVLQLFQILKALNEETMTKEDDDDNKEEEKGDGTKNSGIKERCRYIYCLRDKTRKGYYVQPTSLPPPNPNCFVCRKTTNVIYSNYIYSTHLFQQELLLSSQLHHPDHHN